MASIDEGAVAARGPEAQGGATATAAERALPPGAAQPPTNGNPGLEALAAGETLRRLLEMLDELRLRNRPALEPEALRAVELYRELRTTLDHRRPLAAGR
jgi:hypothetical protein